MPKVYGPRSATSYKVPYEITALMEPHEEIKPEMYINLRIGTVYLERARLISTPQGKRLWARWRTK